MLFVVRNGEKTQFNDFTVSIIYDQTPTVF